MLAKTEDFYSVDKRITIHRLGFENQGKIQKIISEIRTLFKLRRLLLKYKPDSILSFMEKYNAFCVIASAFTGTNIYVSDRSNPLKAVSARIELLRIITYRHANGIIAQTQLAKETLARKTKNRNISVIPNPIKKVKCFPDVCREKIILNIGRLVPEKGQKYLIDAFSKLDNHEWKLVILGEGKLRTDLERQIAQLNMESKVELIGTTEDVDIWFARASIFAFSSVSEGFPNALAEAMSAGLPCVSFNCNAGPGDLITHGVNGFLVEPMNVQSFTKRLSELVANEELRNHIGNEAKSINERLSLQKISNEFYNMICKKL